MVYIKHISHDIYENYIPKIYTVTKHFSFEYGIAEAVLSLIFPVSWKR